MKELEKLSSSHGDDQRAIEQALLARGVPCLEALKHIALDHAVRLRMRKTAIFYATKFDHPSIAPFLAGFINGKNPAALHAACENGDERACEEVGLFSEAKSHAERLGFGVRQVQ